MAKAKQIRVHSEFDKLLQDMRREFQSRERVSHVSDPFLTEKIAREYMDLKMRRGNEEERKERKREKVGWY